MCVGIPVSQHQLLESRHPLVGRVALDEPRLFKAMARLRRHAYNDLERLVSPVKSALDDVANVARFDRVYFRLYLIEMQCPFA